MISAVVFFFCRCSLSNWRSSPLFLFFWEFLTWTDIEFCQIFFSASIEQSMWSFFFSLLILVCYIDRLWSSDLSHIPGINPTWLWFIILFIYRWILFANILLRIFKSTSIKSISMYCLFQYCLVWFGYQGNISFIKWIWKFFHGRDSIKSVLILSVFGSSLPWKYLGCRLLSGSLKITKSFSLTVRGLIKLCISCWVNFGHNYFLRNWSISSKSK